MIKKLKILKKACYVKILTIYSFFWVVIDAEK